MLSDKEKEALERIDYIQDFIIENGQYNADVNDMEYFSKILNLIEKQQKEIESLKASHITTNNKATNTEKAKIFDVIENSIDTYIEKSKPYWEQIMTKDEMTIDEALTIIDDMYQDRYKIMSQKTEKETIVDLGKMDYIKFTNLEWASVRALREVQSLRHEMEKQSKEIEELKKYKEGYKLLSYSLDNYTSKDKIKAKIEELKEDIKYSANPLSIDNSKFGIKVLQSLLPIEKEEIRK